MFRIKICGVTRAIDAKVVSESGADAIGLNFYEKSSRYLTPDKVVEVVNAIPPGIAKVGVFVNETNDFIRRKFADCTLDYVQLHGDESPEQLSELADLPLVRAFRMKRDGVSAVARYLSRLEELKVKLSAVLCDAYAPDVFGGTGKALDTAVVSELRKNTGSLPIVLAGGLNAGNVAQAISASGADGVDTASGVESAPGAKDADMVAAFVRQAHAGLMLGLSE